MCETLVQYFLFIYLGFKALLIQCIVNITTGSFMGRGNHYIQLHKVLYCKLPTNAKHPPVFPLEVGPGFEFRSQTWETRVFPRYHHGPETLVQEVTYTQAAPDIIIKM